MKRRLPNQKCNTRCGYTLIEMLATMAIGATIFLFCVQYMSSTLRVESNNARSLMRTRTLDRLANQFRGDVHSATAAILIPAAPDTAEQLQLTLPENRSIVYAINGVGLTRQQLAGSERQAHEQFVLDHTEMAFEIDDQHSRVTLVLNCFPPQPRRNSEAVLKAKGVPYRAESHLGRRLRFEPGNEDAAAANSGDEP